LKLYLIRHPKPEIAAGICYGQTDLAANSEHCQAVAETLRQHLPAGLNIISSPLKRCLSLAELLNTSQNSSTANLTSDARLKEMHFGDWEMLDWDQISRDEIDQWAQDVVHFAPPNGESGFQVACRVIEFLDCLKTTANTEPLALSAEFGIVAHAGTIGLILAYETGISPENLVQKMLSKSRKISFGECITVQL